MNLLYVGPQSPKATVLRVLYELYSARTVEDGNLDEHCGAYTALCHACIYVGTVDRVQVQVQNIS